MNTVSLQYLEYQSPYYHISANCTETENVWLVDSALYCVNGKLNGKDICTQQADIFSGQLFAPMRPLIGQLSN